MSAVDKAERRRREAIRDHHAQMLDAQSQCVPCKLCGAQAVITDAGEGWGYNIACSAYGEHLRKPKCTQGGIRISGWAYNVSDLWNTLNTRAAPAPAMEAEPVDGVPERIWADPDNLTWVEADPNEVMRKDEVCYIRADLAHPQDAESLREEYRRGVETMASCAYRHFGSVTEAIAHEDHNDSILAARTKALANEDGKLNMSLTQSEEYVASIRQQAEAERDAALARVAEAYSAGAMAVHQEWLRAHEAGEGPTRGDPEFGEAATDYAAFSAVYAEALKDQVETRTKLAQALARVAELEAELPRQYEMGRLAGGMVAALTPQPDAGLAALVKRLDHYRLAWGDLPSIAPHNATSPGLTTGRVIMDTQDAITALRSRPVGEVKASAVDLAMLESMATSFRARMDFSFNTYDMADLLDRIRAALTEGEAGCS